MNAATLLLPPQRTADDPTYLASFGRTPRDDAAHTVDELPALESAFSARFPVAWLAHFTGDQIRAVSVVGDYCRSKAGYCWASNATIAGGLNLHERTVAALLREVEGVLVQCEHRKGGTIARRVEQAGRDVRAVWISAVARNLLSGNRFKVYCAMSYREHLETTTSAKQLAGLCGLRAETARVIAAQLVAEGWVTRHGDEGKAYRFTVNAVPLVGVATQEALFAQPQQRARQQEQVEEAGPAAEQGGVCAGQLDLFALMEAEETPLVSAPTSPLDLTPPSPLGSAPQSSSLDQALLIKPLPAVRGCGSGVAATSVPRGARVREAELTSEVELVTALPALASGVAGRVAAAPEPRKTASTPKQSTLPPLTVTNEIRQVLSLVPELVDRMNRWQQREAAKAIGRAIREVGGDVERVAQRLGRRYVLECDGIRDPYAWLAGKDPVTGKDRGRGLVRRGCHLASCESGTDVDLGGDCQTCAYHVEGAQARHAERSQAQRDHAAVQGQRTAPVLTLAPPLPGPRGMRTMCEQHPATVMPCGLCAHLSDQPPAAVTRLQLIDIAAAGLPAETVTAWIEPDNSPGQAFREQLAARRRERELTGSR
ncbi:hypothetical protein [Kitasatospora kifunensis]|uniref:Helix-turn-helix domain-containing protein n=1 Tax=Kitasatospora kifunensis TaxID=58351 RepID=A0A7W7RBX7_KITKI|nr:hypothetical protein [Kitasatospora kifunensis]MBB4929030.1 hypothetical protein [Kitasatospora kifunensis]